MNTKPESNATEWVNLSRSQPVPKVRESSWVQNGLAIMAVGFLGFFAPQARAESYRLQAQLLVTGAQRQDPKPGEGARYLWERCVGVSTTLGLVNESASCVVGIVTGPDGAPRLVVSGDGVINSANGQVFYNFQGRVTTSGGTGIKNLVAHSIEAVVTITGGTGQFAGAWGRGTMTALVDSDDRLSSAANLTITIPGEK